MSNRVIGWAGFATIIIFVLGLVSVATGQQFPSLTGRVVDESGKLSDKTKQEIAHMSMQHETATSNQVVVVVLNNLRGNDLEEYSNKLARHWGIGQKGKNNGVLLIFSIKERKVRIEVGYGLESKLTDAKSKDILRTYVVPKLRRGDFDAAARDGTGYIINALNGRG
jgi:uncharacterized protein